MRCTMYVIRDVFRCKPGKSRQVAEIFKAALPGFEKAKILTHGRILLDAVTDYWTVILEAEVENLGEYERQMEEYTKRDELTEIA